MFVRVLEGAYITIGDKKRMFLNRSKYTPDGEYRAFEAAVCDDCGRIALVQYHTDCGSKGIFIIHIIVIVALIIAVHHASFVFIFSFSLQNIYSQK